MLTKVIFTQKIGKNIKKVREEKGMSQEELAHKAGFYRTYIGHLENSTYSPSAYTLYKIANALKVELGDIIKLS